MIQLAENDKNILKEVGSIGMGHASTALAQLLNTKINISLPEIKLIKIQDISNFFPEGEILLGVVLKVLGDINGKIFYLFKKAEAYKLIDLIHNKNPSESLTEEMKVSIIKEVSNIMSGSYLNALSKFISLTLLPSIPHLAMDTAASIFDLASMSDEETTSLILIQSKLSMQDTDYSILGSMVLELRQDQLTHLMESVKKKYSP
ncbi:chemotaxis protein CheC [Candidatus Woesearchaeota archaeon]|nr:chemotaxis protein CheC [Candidatus Woesearchaeota archaeon]